MEAAALPDKLAAPGASSITRGRSVDLDAPAEELDFGSMIDLLFAADLVSTSRGLSTAICSYPRVSVQILLKVRDFAIVNFKHLYPVARI
jgi:hypothetical protein